MPKAIRPDDLALYAINTSYFYDSHVLYARKGLPLYAWMEHLRERVLPLYAREIEPVNAGYDTVRDAAAWLDDYYRRYINELTLTGL